MDIGGSPIVGLDLVGEKSSVLGMIINGFPSHAIQIRQTGAPFGGSNVIEENAIGVGKTGLPLANGGDGVHISQQPGNSIVDNVIANNAGEGVSVDGSAAIDNLIHANSMNANGDLGISLTNGGNHLQSAPVISSATEDGSNLTIKGTLHGAPSAMFNFDIFVNGVCGHAGQGQGKTYLGPTSAMTDASGNAMFTAVLAANTSEGLIATATATDSAGNTSEFSTCAAVSVVPPTILPPIANAGPNQTVTAGTLVTLNGSGSSDPNVPALPLTFAWKQTFGPAVTLTGATTATPTFTPMLAGSYVFSMTVSNGTESATASVTITVTASEPVVLIEALIDQVESLGLDRGLERRLVASLNAAENAVQHKHFTQAIDRMLKFIGDVLDPNGKTIPKEEAEELVEAAFRVIGSILSSV
jgi:hypothetical protein